MNINYFFSQKHHALCMHNFCCVYLTYSPFYTMLHFIQTSSITATASLFSWSTDQSDGQE